MTTKRQSSTQPDDSGNKLGDLQTAQSEILAGLTKLKALGLIKEIPDLQDIPKVLRKLATLPRKTRPKDGKLAPDTVEAFVQWFIQSPVEDLYDVKCGQWQCITGDASKGTAHALIFNSELLKNEHHKGDKAKAAHVICVRSTTGNPVAIFNASSVTYGTSTWRAQKNPQRWAEQYGAIPVPFETIKVGAKLNLLKAEVLQWTGSERMLIPPAGHSPHSEDFNIINRHFAGAVVLKVENDYFLFDTDREELHYHNFNPFFTQLPKPVSTVEEAYAALMPKEVRAAHDAGVEVIRQGEFFFVKVPDDEVRSLVYEQVAGSKPEAYTQVAYNHLVDRALVYGAREFNLELLEARWHAEKWLAAYKKNLKKKSGTDAIDPDSPEAIPDPEAAIHNYLCWLDTQVGSKEARLSEADIREIRREADKYIYYHSTDDYGFAPIEHELEMRLDEDTGMDRDTQLRFDMKHSASPDDDPTNRSRQSNGHKVTLTFVHPTDKRRRYALGSVFHQGRQHRPIYLPGWYRIYVNTATQNWTVHGDVD